MELEETQNDFESLKQKHEELKAEYSKILKELKARNQSSQDSPKLQRQLTQVQQELEGVKQSLAESVEDKTALSLKLDVFTFETYLSPSLD